MSADGARCECGNQSIGHLNRTSDRIKEPICGPCLERITGQHPSGKDTKCTTM